MKRGIISTSPGAITQLIKFLEDERITDQSLLDRLSHMIGTDQKNLDLQISSEEAELFLDTLPPPTLTDSKELAQLRESLHHFINSTV